jgi:hypothetical protein
MMELQKYVEKIGKVRGKCNKLLKKQKPDYYTFLC